ncbi:MAG: amidase, partial [Betaproteobacteria bacterium]|nr:amidase [Betaproteobacteria bacterium]
MNEIVANDKLGAFCRHTHAEMEGAAEGPLAGLTFGVKDIYDIAGHKTGFG